MKEKKKKGNEENGENDENTITFIIITLGDSGVGKTSIINRYINNEFNDNNPSTIGMNFSFKKLYINKQKIKLKLMDTCGQEKYRSLTKTYLKNADFSFICLCFK